MCIYIYICIYMYICKYVYMYIMYKMYICIYICIYVYMHVLTHVYNCNSRRGFSNKKQDRDYDGGVQTTARPGGWLAARIDANAELPLGLAEVAVQDDPPEVPHGAKWASGRFLGYIRKLDRGIRNKIQKKFCG